MVKDAREVFHEEQRRSKRHQKMSKMFYYVVLAFAVMLVMFISYVTISGE